MNLNLNGVTIEVSDASILEMLRQRIAGPVAPAANRPRLGDYWQGQGGIYVGDILGQGGKSQYSLVVASGHQAQMQWGGLGVVEKGAESHYDGLANTIALAESKADHPMVKWVRDITVDGHNDFYIFARNEARLCFVNGRDLFNKDGWYWTSTQNADVTDWAWVQDFDDGTQSYDDKDVSHWVCAVRRVNYSLIQ